MCDKHIVKMTLETAQLLCSPFKDSDIIAPYRITHYNHPCSIWARTSIENFFILYKYGVAISNEYTYRYEKKHKSLDVIEWCFSNINHIPFLTINKTEPPQCMPDNCKDNNLITAYRAYYKLKQTEIKMAWSKRHKPKWLKS